MTIRPILDVADDLAVLKQKSLAVGEVDDEVRALMDDMLETMYAAPGIGLAAIQIGVPRRVVVMDLAREEEPRAPKFMVDPVVTWASEERSVYDEGCLSIPEIYDAVERPARVRVAYLDRGARGWRRRPRASTPPTTATACCSSTTCHASSATAPSPR